MLKWILATLALGTVTSPLWAQTDPPKNTGELLYQFKSPPSEKSMRQLMSWGISEVGAGIRLTRAVGKSSTELAKTREAMLASGLFSFVSYNTIESEAAFPGTQEVERQWHHRMIASDQAWDYTLGLQDIIVAVCDSGIQPDHEDLQGQVLPGWSLIENRPDSTTATSHGTFVAGLIAAQLANGLGGAGIAPRIRLLPLRISNNQGSATMKRITDCIQLAADGGARVVNVSFTGIENEAVEAAGRYAYDKGTLLVYAAGNQGKYRSLKSFPDYPHVLAVGATNQQDRRWTFRKNIFVRGGSNYGPFIDLVAPGHNLYSTTTYQVSDVKAQKYRFGSGTSYAAPVVSGVAALILSANPTLTVQEVEEILKLSADQIGEENVFGAGRVNALAAVRRALESARRR